MRYESIAQRGAPYPTFLDAFLDSYTNIKTVKDARRSVLELSAYARSVHDANASAVRQWKNAELAKPPSNQRASGTMSKVATFNAEYFNYLQDKEIIDDSLTNPFRGVRFKPFASKASYVALTLQEIMTVRDASVKAGDNELTAFIDIGRYTGMRIAEISALTSESVVCVDGVQCLKVKGDAKTKASAGRLVPIAPALTKLLSLCLQKMAEKEGLIRAALPPLLEPFQGAPPYGSASKLCPRQSLSNPRVLFPYSKPQTKKRPRGASFIWMAVEAVWAGIVSTEIP